MEERDRKGREGSTWIFVRGKTANCLLGAYVIAHSAVLKAVDEFVRMREITRSVKVALKCLIAVVLVDDDCPY